MIENLKRTTFAPSVQMTDVPRDPEGMNDEADAELDDADEDENADSRYTKRRWDKYIEKEGELSDSEDEDENEANGVRRQPNAPKRRRNMMDYQNSHAAPDDNLASGGGSPGSGRSRNGSANGIDSHTASDEGREGSPLSDESEKEPYEDGAPEDSVSSGNHEDDDDMDMIEDDEDAIQGPQEATPPESPPAIAPNSSVPAPTVDETGDNAMDEGDTLDDPEPTREHEQRQREDVTAEKSTEAIERTEQ